VRAAVLPLTAALFILFVVGIIVLWRRDRALALLIGGTVGYFILISAGGESEWRFRVPVMPEYVIAAGAAISGRRPYAQRATASIVTSSPAGISPR
jgi:hypothetical protein